MMASHLIRRDFKVNVYRIERISGGKIRRVLVPGVVVVDGSITSSLDGAALWRGEFEAVLDGTAAYSALDDMMIGNAELDVYLGHSRDLDDDIVLHRVCVLRVDSVERELGSPRLRISAFDRCGFIAERPILATFKVADSTVVNAIRRLVSGAFGYKRDFDVKVGRGVNQTKKPPRGTTYVGDRWKHITTLLDMIDSNLAAGADGNLWITRRPGTNGGSSAATLKHGENGVVVENTVTLDRDRLYNCVMVTSTTPDGKFTASGAAYDTDSKSPIYVYGPYGIRGISYTRSGILTDKMTSAQRKAACVEVAKSILARQRKLVRQCSITMVYTSSLRARQFVTIESFEARDPMIPARDLYIISELTIPMRGGTISLAARKWVYVSQQERDQTLRDEVPGTWEMEARRGL